MPRLLHELETPAPVVDLDRMAQNLDTMAAYAALHGLALRPHVKTHKSTRIAAEQLRLGARGLTCATLHEMEVMSEVTGDLLLAHPPVGDPKLVRLLLMASHVRLSVVLDSPAALLPLGLLAADHGRKVRVLVEADMGMRRVGVQSPTEAVALAERIAELPSLEYGGLMFYPGHIRQRVEDQGPELKRLEERLGEFIDALDRAGLRPAVVSGGSTPAGFRMHEVRGITEVRPGTYVYNDRATAELGACAWEDVAFTVLATVVSTAVPGQAVIDAGSKALGREPLPAGPEAGFGALQDRPEVTVVRMSEEHGILDLSRTTWRPAVGDRVR
ncbi:MAG TPA: alanine racemase, partial [Gemmatimonadaceae bacterium]|nr:alanine racemase [Gemmatimonadaceae bacterium]